ncbi:hypothetical protein [Campylobacter troglodytis]|nr:hypothetical protein [Campylobacter troglodytis]
MRDDFFFFASCYAFCNCKQKGLHEQMSVDRTDSSSALSLRSVSTPNGL